MQHPGPAVPRLHHGRVPAQDAAARELQKEAEAKTRALALRDASQQQLESFKARLLNERCVMFPSALSRAPLRMNEPCASAAGHRRGRKRRSCGGLRWCSKRSGGERSAALCCAMPHWLLERA
jgi:hypothetical protein